jgi:hypothetical protein
MRKLTLDLEELVVESFDTADVQGTGTVNAHETFDSECRCDTDSCQCGSVESCTACGCDTPGYTCEARCWPQPITDAIGGVLVGD